MHIDGVRRTRHDRDRLDANAVVPTNCQSTSVNCITPIKPYFTKRVSTIVSKVESRTGEYKMHQHTVRGDGMGDGKDGAERERPA